MSEWLEQNKGLLVIFSIVATVFAGGYFYTNQPDPPPLEISTLTPTLVPTETSIPPTVTPAPTSTPSPVRVYITGQVNKPDVYFLPAGSIIKDAIAAAGGATAEADLLAVNQAQEVLDQQQITIPAKADNHPTPDVIEGGEKPTVAPEQHPASPTEQDSPASGGIININTANLDQLTTLTGIGPAIGQRIIDYRDEYGDFANVEDLTNVKGIGPATFEKVKDSITVK